MSITRSTLLLRGLRVNSKIYVAVTGYMYQLYDLRGCYGVYVSIIRYTWMLRGVRDDYMIYVAVTGYTCQLHDLCCC